MPYTSDLLATFGVSGHAWHCSVVPALARLVRFTINPDPTGAIVTVLLRQPTLIIGAAPIAQTSDGSSTTVVLIRSRAGAVAIAVRYAATYLQAQPAPRRAILAPNWVHVYRADAFEIALAVQLLRTDLADSERRSSDA